MPEQHEMKGPGVQSGTYAKRGRFWAVTDAAGRLVCLAVYKKGAQEVLRRLVAGSTPATNVTPVAKATTTETRRQKGERG